MEQDSHHDLTHQLTNKHACYILITCGQPEKDGQMHIQMSYEGDKDLISYLIDGAKDVIDHQCDTPSFQDENALRLVK